jgi:hypothetical protein
MYEGVGVGGSVAGWRFAEAPLEGYGHALSLFDGFVTSDGAGVGVEVEGIRGEPFAPLCMGHPGCRFVRRFS